MNLPKVIPRLCSFARQSNTVSALNRTLCSYHSSFKFKPLLRNSGNLKINVIQVRDNTTSKKLPIIYLFTKDDCSLCDEAVELLQPHMHRFVLEKVDITLPENEHWYNLYKYDIPVFHIYEEFLFQHRVDFEALEKGLEKYKDGYK